MHRIRDRIIAAVILLASLAIFRLSPLHVLTDSNYEMLFSQQLFRHHSFSIDGREIEQLRSRRPGQVHHWRVDLPYQLWQSGERFYYLYPMGSAVLSVPLVAVENWFGQFAKDKSGLYSHEGETQIQADIAALLMAVLCVVVFFTSRLLLNAKWSLLVVALIGFGTQVWSTGSRVVWSHTWGVLILSFAIHQLVRSEVRNTPARPVLLATCLAWMYFVRPTFSISVVAITVYVFLYHRPIWWRFFWSGAAWLALFVGYSEYHFGHVLPPYYLAQQFALNTFFEGLAGVLFSPSRGLFIYVPALAMIAYLLGRYRNPVRNRLVLLALAVCLVETLVLAGFKFWYGGHCYGPRLLTDLVPWFALLSILAVEARLRWRERESARDSARRIAFESVMAALLISLSITVNGLGAAWGETWKWNVFPVNVDRQPARVWDWKHPQLLGAPAG